PALAEADEEGAIVLSAGGPIGIVGGRKSRDVGDVLAERELSVLVKIGKRLVRVVLRDQLRRGGLEVREVFGRPPVGEVASGVELAALVVEAVADLVADDRADGA